MKFTDYALQPYLQKALADLKFTQPTPIQERIIPLLLKGESVIGQSQTGSGRAIVSYCHSSIKLTLAVKNCN